MTFLTFALRTVGVGSHRPFIIRVNRSAVPYLSHVKILLAAGMALVLLLNGQTRPVQWLRNMTLDFTRVIVATADEPIQHLVQAGSQLSVLLKSHQALSEEVAYLRQQNENLLKWQGFAEHMRLENEALRQSAKALMTIPLTQATSRVMSVQLLDHGHSLLIEGGTSNDFNKNQPVLSAQGVLGRLCDVGPTTSRVLLLTDLSSRVPVVIAGTTHQAILTGTNGEFLKVTRFAQQVTPRVGDRLLTSGQGGIFPAGLAVAEIVSVEGEHVFARPFASQTEEFVIVLESINS